MLNRLYEISNAKSRSISPENLTGKPGQGGRCPLDQSTNLAPRELGLGWKVHPTITVEAKSTATLADIEGSGVINHIWCTFTNRWRNVILRIYWDDQEYPSVECPLGDFFCMGWNEYAQISSLAVCVNPGSGFNCYWQMPFKKHCKITLENIAEDPMHIFYEISYTIQDLPDEIAYFHAQFRRVNPLPYKDVYTIVDGIEGKGQYVGTYMAWGLNNNLWWGEGEIKFYIDDDSDFPTICGTGTEDYFCGSYDFKDPVTRDRYVPFTTPYTGIQVIEPDRLFRSQFRFGLYRWHILDPIHFEKRLRVTIQDLGWREGKRYLPRQDDIASVAFWYQNLPAARFPQLPDKDYLEVI